MDKYFTGAGDDGTTGSLEEGRSEKDNIRFETLGTLDECSAHCGVVRAYLTSAAEKEMIQQIQQDLYQIMAETAADKSTAQKFRSIGEDQVKWVEQQIDRMAASVKLPSGFILPGETVLSAEVSVTRTVIRRAERRLAAMFHQDLIENNFLLQYLNRLSSLFFLLEVKTAKSGASDLLLARKDV